MMNEISKSLRVVATDYPPRDPEPDFEAERTIDLSAITGFVRRQIWVILATAIAMMALTLLVAFQLTPLYTARVLVQVDTATQRMTDNEMPTMTLATSTGFVAGQVDVIRSDSVIRRTVRELRLAEHPAFEQSPSLLSRARDAVLGARPEPGEARRESQLVNSLANQVRVSRIGQTFNLEVAFTSADPRLAAQIANGIVDSYIAVQVEKKAASARHASSALSQRVEEIAANLVRIENEIARFIAASVGTDNDEAQNLNAEVLRLSRERGALASALETTRAALRDGDVAAAAAAVGSVASAEAAPAPIASLGDELARLMEERTRAAPTVAPELDVQIASLATDFDATLTLSIADIEARERAARERLSSVLGDQNGSASVALFRLQTEAESARAIYRVALDLLKRAEIGSDVQVPDARVISEAVPPIVPSFPPTNLFLAISALVGLALGGGLGLMREFFFTGFVSPSQVESLLKLPVATTIPFLGSNTHRPQDEVVARPLSPFTEALRRWRLVLDGAAAPGEALTILVTSAVPGEGKSTLALSLARLYASSRRKVVIVDCDLRRPNLARLAGITDDNEIRVGIFDFLRRDLGEASANELVRHDERSGVDMIVGKPSRGEATDHLLASHAFVELIVLLRKHYEVIILDSPPLVPVIDGRILMRHADIVTHVVHWGSTSPADAIAAARDLRTPGGPPVCAVLNMSRAGSAGYRGYGYKHGYGE
ncbi:GumC family protein [Salinarimonas sp.]|uniref:GumC family protein n=1 Tax=Salinarimonas sp. TaxID=2766526 RepID=UPI00391CA12E